MYVVNMQFQWKSRKVAWSRIIELIILSFDAVIENVTI